MAWYVGNSESAPFAEAAQLGPPRQGAGIPADVINYPKGFTYNPAEESPQGGGLRDVYGRLEAPKSYVSPLVTGAFPMIPESGARPVIVDHTRVRKTPMHEVTEWSIIRDFPERSQEWKERLGYDPSCPIFEIVGNPGTDKMFRIISAKSVQYINSILANQTVYVDNGKVIAPMLQILGVPLKVTEGVDTIQDPVALSARGYSQEGATTLWSKRVGIATVNDYWYRTATNYPQISDTLWFILELVYPGCEDFLYNLRQTQGYKCRLTPDWEQKKLTEHLRIHHGKVYDQQQLRWQLRPIYTSMNRVPSQNLYKGSNWEGSLSRFGMVKALATAKRKVYHGEPSPDALVTGHASPQRFQDACLLLPQLSVYVDSRTFNTVRG